MFLSLFLEFLLPLSLLLLHYSYIAFSLKVSVSLSSLFPFPSFSAIPLRSSFSAHWLRISLFPLSLQVSVSLSLSNSTPNRSLKVLKASGWQKSRAGILKDRKRRMSLEGSSGLLGAPRGSAVTPCGPWRVYPKRRGPSHLRSSPPEACSLRMGQAQPDVVGLDL